MSDNLDHRHHHNRPDNKTRGQLCSILMSKALDCLGYNQGMVKYRVAHWKLKDVIMNNTKNPNYPLHLITAGSQAEGVVGNFGSDIDSIFVEPDVICTDTHNLIIGDRQLTIFQTVNHDTAPGYTKLKLVQMGHPECDNTIQESLLLSEFGERYLSSDLFIKKHMIMTNKLNRKYTSKRLTRSGPALPLYNKSTPDCALDVVNSFKCNCPALLRSLLRRPRRHNWPPRNVLYDISQMDAHVVPVGCKGSDTYDLEWRICFTKAEIHLIHCLNDTQTKLYIVLKMISKQLLKSLCSEITSYIMKNIVLWICEYCPSDWLINNQLWYLIILALVFLKKCVTQNYLPSYMIPERNLFNSRIEPEEQLKLTGTLATLIEEGPPAAFKRIDKLRDAMLFVHRAPEIADYNRIQRDLVEKLFLLHNIRMAVLSQPGKSDEEREQVWKGDELFVTLQTAVLNLVVPEWRNLLHRGVDTKQMYKDKIISFLS